ncbi:MAG TPA: translation elongation factor Ts [Candidatus Gallimonas intestinigallinarum]|uniref:Elongation factor Ts n=1 Tax=Candidatus Gallimonas intestinigallinarum TaxID=2838604 RepID=A0A9D2DWS1_9FIRM|nr:translation elongation factor Ts [Candidatus Gallimonas intestinigallinarum]
MAEFTAKDVMKLREQTGAGMMDCKRALVDADGDMDKAADLLRERGIAKAAKRASKIAAEGIVYALVEGKTGVLVEVNCESDFVAKGDKFKELVDAVAKQIAAVKPADVEALLASDMGGKTVETYIQEQVAVIGEKISVRRFTVYETEGFIETYIHMGGTMGVMLNFTGEPTEKAKAVAHDVALHVAFAKPQYMTEAEVSAETLEKEKNILLQEVINEGKPANIAEKIVMGKIKKFYEENCLMDKKFVKDDKITIAQLLAQAGAGVTVKQFCFFVRGEGLEKKNEDLSEEVAKQVEAMKK